MAFVHDSCSEGLDSGLDLWTLPPTQTSVTAGFWETSNPMSSISDDGPLEFVITNGDPETYLDLANTYLYVKAKVCDGNGDPVEADTNVAPINYWLHTLWQQVDVYLNDKLITASTNMYPYRAYIEALLSYGSEAKKTQLTNALWFRDTPDHFDGMRENKNTGFAMRFRMTEQSQSVDLMGRLHCDIFHQNRYLLNNVNVRVKLTRSKSAFNLMSDEQDAVFKPVIEEAYLLVRKVKVNPGVQLGHLKALEKQPALYPIRRVVTKYFTVGRGQTVANQENLFMGTLPKRLIVGCVGGEAFDGDYTHNPLQFSHCNIQYLALNVAGRQIPSKPYTPDFTSAGPGDGKTLAREYGSLFSSTGKAFRDEGNGIPRMWYDKGYTLFAFDLTPNLTEGEAFDLVRRGNLRLEIRFDRPLEQTINVICYAEFDNVIQIDKARHVLCDFSS